ncbi:MAG: phosphate signaling complex protein PhoU [Chloroflexi bacterium]|nr:phosphate signaling complex protein PhoU [Chloroflexota bacterium]
MLRAVFEHQLEQLQEQLLIMSSQVEDNLVTSTSALQQCDHAFSEALIAADAQINAAYIHIEEVCLALIATQQPRARDLRFITAVMAIAGELERINDYAKGVAKINLQLGHQPRPTAVSDLCVMAEKARHMLTQSMNAFLARDASLAYVIYAADAEIDALYSQIQQDLLAVMLSDFHQTPQANKLMWAAHNLERAGDRVGNICERVIYLVTGELVELPTAVINLSTPAAP